MVENGVVTRTAENGIDLAQIGGGKGDEFVTICSWSITFFGGGKMMCMHMVGHPVPVAVALAEKFVAVRNRKVPQGAVFVRIGGQIQGGELCHEALCLLLDG